MTLPMALPNFLPFSTVIAQHDLRNKRVFIRADLNVPLNADAGIADDARIVAALPAIQWACKAGAAVMVSSHLGRPQEGQCEPSLAPVATRLSVLLGQPVRLRKNWVHGVALAPGDIVLLENCRCNRGEKANDPELSRSLAKLCDVYVNDAFGTAHRAEATTVGMVQWVPVACAGPLLCAELEAISRVLQNPRRPLVAIVGGAKVSTKLKILTTLIEKVDTLIVGGGIANTFLAAAGVSVGQSLIDAASVQDARQLMQDMQKRGVDFPLPVDVVCAPTCTEDARARDKNIHAVEAADRILDIGPQTTERWAAVLEKAGTILWNGPVGVFELSPFSRGTQHLAQAIAKSQGFPVAGGGDTLAAIAKYGVKQDITYISTGGGAFLECLEGKTLPAVAALIAHHQCVAGQ